MGKDLVPTTLDNTHDRYFVTLAAKNILGKARADFHLFRTELDDQLMNQVANENGFNSNHPNYSELIHQIERTFTLREISQIIVSLGTLPVLEISIEVAGYHVNDPMVLRKGETKVIICPVGDTFDFSILEGYSLPFVVKGIYDPYQYH
jgi:hypothetical protein